MIVFVALARLLVDRDGRAACVEFAQQLLGQRARGRIGRPQLLDRLRRLARRSDRARADRCGVVAPLPRVR